MLVAWLLDYSHITTVLRRCIYIYIKNIRLAVRITMCTVQILTLYKILISIFDNYFISVNLRCIWREVSLLMDIKSSNLFAYTLQWRHNGCDSISNHQPHDWLLNLLFRRRSMKASKLRIPGLCAGNSPVTGEFPAHMASKEENVSIWWLHHVHRCVSRIRR